MKKIFLVVSFILIGILISCTNSVQKKAVENSKFELPEILTAEYEVKTLAQTEQGFDVRIRIHHTMKDLKVKAIVLNHRLFDKILISETKPNVIFIEQFLAVNSQLIVDFVPPPADSRQDGIIFEYGGEEFFIEAKFKTKK